MTTETTLKASELRIGNWIAKRIGFDKIISIYSNKVVVSTPKEDEYGYATLNMYDVKPIPLTKEIIEKAGMREKEDNVYYSFDRPNIKLTYVGQWHCYVDSYPITLNYLHQLQNLYFALTGTELTIQL